MYLLGYVLQSIYLNMRTPSPSPEVAAAGSAQGGSSVEGSDLVPAQSDAAVVTEDSAIVQADAAPVSPLADASTAESDPSLAVGPSPSPDLDESDLGERDDEGENAAGETADEAREAETSEKESK